MPRQSDVVKDFSDFKVNRVYGTKPLTVSDSVFLGYIKRAVQEEVDIEIKNAHPEKYDQ